MERKPPDGIVAGVLKTDRDAVIALHARCNEADGIDIPLDLEWNAESGETETGFGAYRGGALAGFALLPASRIPEATLFVAPDVRRRGIGGSLLDAIRAEARRRRLTAFMAVTDAASRAGTAFLAAVGARYRESEYRLLLDPARIDRSPRRYPDLVLRPAGPADVPTLARLRAAAFAEPDEAAVRASIEQSLGDERRRYHLGLLGEEPVGLLRTSIWESEADVTAFGVLPSHQGRGFGRQMLRDAIDLLLLAGQARITIEVATGNENALGLYRSCGFDVIAKFDYYDVTA